MKKTYDELERDLRNKNDLIEDLERNINKISFILSEWIEDYSFYEKPDPRKALQWTLENIEDRHCQQSAKWFWEYNRIHELIEIGIDYTRISKGLITDIKGVK